MHIKSIHLQNFRNHSDKQVDWAPHINVITGPNGAGKTNLIDGIHYLCMTSSFVSNSDRYVLQQDAPYFTVKGNFKGNIRSDFSISCSYSYGEGKKIFVNESPLDRLSDLIGRVPVVVLSPQDKKLTAEGPKQRRAFIDSLISQISQSYLQDLFDFRKARRQRNKLLKKFRGPREVLIDYLEPWDAQLIQFGSKIVAERAAVLNQFQKYLARQYQQISGMPQKPHLEYQTFCEPTTLVEEVEKRYKAKLKEERERELEREVTVVGPHRDEIIFYLDNKELRKYGSQGQHRLFALSLKLAQLYFFTEQLDDQPIFLLDDVFGDLDQHRTEVLLNALTKHNGQTFITSATPQIFKDVIDFDTGRNQQYFVKDGEVTRI
ncbi:MAG TPA: DNA replication/repair protein RecF [Balneolaceae bacterium]|nr:DNA replication/repair protein RecF [Balneolaceae bacterium]